MTRRRQGESAPHYATPLLGPARAAAAAAAAAGGGARRRAPLAAAPRGGEERGAALAVRDPCASVERHARPFGGTPAAKYVRSPAQRATQAHALEAALVVRVAAFAAGDAEPAASAQTRALAAAAEWSASRDALQADSESDASAGDDETYFEERFGLTEVPSSVADEADVGFWPKEDIDQVVDAALTRAAAAGAAATRPASFRGTPIATKPPVASAAMAGIRLAGFKAATPRTALLSPRRELFPAPATEAAERLLDASMPLAGGAPSVQRARALGFVTRALHRAESPALLLQDASARAAALRAAAERGAFAGRRLHAAVAGVEEHGVVLGQKGGRRALRYRLFSATRPYEAATFTRSLDSAARPYHPTLGFRYTY